MIVETILVSAAIPRHTLALRKSGSKTDWISFQSIANSTEQVLWRNSLTAG